MSFSLFALLFLGVTVIINADAVELQVTWDQPVDVRPGDHKHNIKGWYVQWFKDGARFGSYETVTQQRASRDADGAGDYQVAVQSFSDRGSSRWERSAVVPVTAGLPDSPRGPIIKVIEQDGF